MNNRTPGNGVWDARITAAITTSGRCHGHHLRLSLGDLTCSRASTHRVSCTNTPFGNALTRGELRGPSS